MFAVYYHKEAVLKMITLPSSTQNLAKCMSNSLKKEKLERQQCFLNMLTNIRYLARQSLPLRGHGNPETQTKNESNFLQLMKLRGEDDSRIAGWLEKETDEYTSLDTQNKILKIMALQVRRQVIESMYSSPFLPLMIDETTDVSNKEQLVICIPWVDNSLQPHEEFIGLYHVESTQSSTLVHTIHDVLQRVNGSITK